MVKVGDLVAPSADNDYVRKRLTSHGWLYKVDRVSQHGQLAECLSLATGVRCTFLPEDLEVTHAVQG